MSFRLSLLAAVGALAMAAAPALAFQTDFSTAAGSTTPLTLPSGNNTLIFSSPTDPGTFSVGSTGGLFTFATGLGDFLSATGDTLKISFAHPVTTGIALTFGLEDAFGLNGSDTLSVTTSNGVTETLTTALNTLTLSEPQGSGIVNAPGLTFLTITSANPFAIASVASVPEPMTMALLGVGLAGLVAARRRG